MLKKLLAVNVLLAMGSSFAVAGGMGSLKAPAPTYQAGPYVGFSVGPQVNVSGQPLTYVGTEGTLSLGLAHLWKQRFYLAGEVFGGDSVKLKTYGGTATTVKDVRSSWSYGFDLLPGLMVNDYSLVYARGGVINTEFEGTTPSGVKTGHPTGWQVGLGGQTNVYKNLDARLEYVYSLYPNQTDPNINKIFTNLFNFGLVYKFV